MAIIKCPECQHEVSDQAKVCPFCGVDIAGNLINCPDCGKILLKNTQFCPNCKCLVNQAPVIPVVKSKVYKESDIPTTPEEHEPRHVGTWLIFSILTILFIGIGGYFYLQDKNHKDAMIAEFNALQNSFDISAHKDFVAKYPKTDYATRILEKIDTLQDIEVKWATIAKCMDKPTYEAFLKEFPKSAYSDACEHIVDSLDWIEASTSNTLEGYQAYLSRHAHGVYAQTAQKCKEELDKLVVSPEEKGQIQQIASKYIYALAHQDMETLGSLCTERMYSQSISLGAGATYSIIGNINVSKALSSVSENCNYVAKFLLERNANGGSESGSTSYTASLIITPNLHVAMIRMVPIEQ